MESNSVSWSLWLLQPQPPPVWTNRNPLHMHSICKHQDLLHLSSPWSLFPLNTTLGNKETRSSNLCSEIKHWLSNAQVLEARLWGWFDPPLRWWKIRRILPNHMPESVQLHSNSRSNHRSGLHHSSLNWDWPLNIGSGGKSCIFCTTEYHRESLQPHWKEVCQSGKHLDCRNRN